MSSAAFLAELVSMSFQSTELLPPVAIAPALARPFPTLAAYCLTEASLLILASSSERIPEAADAAPSVLAPSPPPQMLP